MFFLAVQQIHWRERLINTQAAVIYLGNKPCSQFRQWNAGIVLRWLLLKTCDHTQNLGRFLRCCHLFPVNLAFIRYMNMYVVIIWSLTSFPSHGRSVIAAVDIAWSNINTEIVDYSLTVSLHIVKFLIQSKFRLYDFFSLHSRSKSYLQSRYCQKTSRFVNLTRRVCYWQRCYYRRRFHSEPIKGSQYIGSPSRSESEISVELPWQKSRLGI